MEFYQLKDVHQDFLEIKIMYTMQIMKTIASLKILAKSSTLWKIYVQHYTNTGPP